MRVDDPMTERLRAVAADATGAPKERAPAADPLRAAEEMRRWIEEAHERVGSTPDAVSATVGPGGTSFRVETTMNRAAAEKLYGKPIPTPIPSGIRRPLSDATRSEPTPGESHSGFVPSPVGAAAARLLELLGSRVRRPTMPAWMESVLKLDEDGQAGSALDELFGHMDSMLTASEFDAIDKTISAMPVEGPSLSLMMGLLSITRPAASHLPSRERFFLRVYRLCKAMRRDAELLLGGLK